jgi:hypothetical protein
LEVFRAAVPSGGIAASLDVLLKLKHQVSFGFGKRRLNAAACLVSLIEKTAGGLPAKQKL